MANRGSFRGGRLTVMAVPGLDPGIVPAIHAVMPRNQYRFMRRRRQPI
jgi:hypothetical protein